MNVIVVVCNSLHLGFLGAYGNSWIETPHLDRLAAEGVVFDQHFPENLTTLPTRRSWWTGRYGFADPAQGWTPLRLDELILPDMLWNKGVQTAFFSDVPMLREAGRGSAGGLTRCTGFAGKATTRSSPPATAARRRSACRTSRASGSPPPMIPITNSGRALGAVLAESGRAPHRGRGEHRGGTDRPGGDRLAERRGDRRDR